MNRAAAPANAQGAEASALDIAHAVASVERVVHQVAAPVKQEVHHTAALVEHAA